MNVALNNTHTHWHCVYLCINKSLFWNNTNQFRVWFDFVLMMTQNTRGCNGTMKLHPLIKAHVWILFGGWRGDAVKDKETQHSSLSHSAFISESSSCIWTHTSVTHTHKLWHWPVCLTSNNSVRLSMTSWSNLHLHRSPRLTSQISTNH